MLGRKEGNAALRAARDGAESGSPRRNTRCSFCSASRASSFRGTLTRSRQHAVLTKVTIFVCSLTPCLAFFVDSQRRVHLLTRLRTVATGWPARLAQSRGAKAVLNNPEGSDRIAYNLDRYHTEHASITPSTARLGGTLCDCGVVSVLCESAQRCSGQMSLPESSSARPNTHHGSNIS
jgi:hypothetical protein